MRLIKWAGVPGLACAWFLPATPVRAGETSCKMSFQLSGWSLFYKTASGSGTVRCSNGQTLHVKLRAKGGGLTLGKTTASYGIRKFSGVSSVREVLGRYAHAEGCRTLRRCPGTDQGQRLAGTQRQGRGLESWRGIRCFQHRIGD